MRLIRNVLIYNKYVVFEIFTLFEISKYIKLDKIL